VSFASTTAGDVDSQLVPVLRFNARSAKIEIAAWTEPLVRETAEKRRGDRA
jgi:hypothetical protein